MTSCKGFAAVISNSVAAVIFNSALTPSAFKRWLAQDYVFVREFVPFVASVLIKASKQSPEDMEVVLGGLASLSGEIDWFKREASKRDVSLANLTVHNATRNYCRLLEKLTFPEVEYAVAITAFWAIEAVYQESFAHCLEDGNNTPPEFVEACQRWGSPGFREYCRSLQQIANRCLEKAPEHVVAAAETTFITILEHEIEFWNVSSGGT